MTDVRNPVTARLRAEPLGPEHRDELIDLLGDPRVGEWLGGAATPELVDEQIAAQQAHWERHGFGWWAWRDRATGELVARGGLWWLYVGGRDEVEAGWTVKPERWGEGIATELGAKSVELGFGPLGLRELVSLTLPGNVRSRRVMEKLGFAYERDVVHANLPHVLYRRSTDSARSTSGSVV